MSGLPGDAPEPGPYAGDVYPVPPAAPPADGAGLVAVTLTNSVRTSWPERLAGNGPWFVRLPGDEAGRVIADRNGVYGHTVPRGYLGSVEPVPAALIPRRAPLEAPR